MGARQVYVGTSGWVYKDWKGTFYPPGLKDADRLGYYAARFNTVEANVSFYRTPTPVMVDAWNRRLPADFQMVLKGPRMVTHLKKLIDYREPLAFFLERVGPLATLKVILWQLPPSLGRDLDRLDGFLAELPQGVRHAVEFRHESWWDEATWAVLSRHQAAMVAISHPRLPAAIVPTTDFVYVRFHGLGDNLYLYDYSDDELAGWAERLAPLLDGRTLYAFFNNDYHAHAPRNAVRLREMLTNQVGGTL